MSEQVKVSSIVIRYADGTTKDLSLEDAKALHEQLEGLFGRKTEYIPSAPIYVERDRYPWAPPYRYQVEWTSDQAPGFNTSQPLVFCCSSND